MKMCQKFWFSDNCYDKISLLIFGFISFLVKKYSFNGFYVSDILSFSSISKHVQDVFVRRING